MEFLLTRQLSIIFNCSLIGLRQTVRRAFGRGLGRALADLYPHCRLPFFPGTDTQTKTYSLRQEGLRGSLDLWLLGWNHKGNCFHGLHLWPQDDREKPLNSVRVEG